MNIALDVHAVNALRDGGSSKGRAMDRLLDTEHENERIVLGLLNSVEHDGDKSQRHIAAELGIRKVILLPTGDAPDNRGYRKHMASLLELARTMAL